MSQLKWQIWLGSSFGASAAARKNSDSIENLDVRNSPKPQPTNVSKEAVFTHELIVNRMMSSMKTKAFKIA